MPAPASGIPAQVPQPHPGSTPSHGARAGLPDHRMGALDHVRRGQRPSGLLRQSGPASRPAKPTPGPGWHADARAGAPDVPARSPAAPDGGCLPRRSAWTAALGALAPSSTNRRRTDGSRPRQAGLPANARTVAGLRDVRRHPFAEPLPGRCLDAAGRPPGVTGRSHDRRGLPPPSGGRQSGASAPARSRASAMSPIARGSRHHGSLPGPASPARSPCHAPVVTRCGSRLPGSRPGRMPSPAMAGPACVPSVMPASQFHGILIENPLHGIDAGHDAEAVEAGGDIPPGRGDGPSGVDGAGMHGGGWCRRFHGVASLSGFHTPGLALEGRGADLCPGFDIGRDIPDL